MTHQEFNKKEVKSYSTLSAFPTTGSADTIYIDKATNTPYYFDTVSGTYKPLSASGTAETITTMVKNADGSFTYTSENGTQTILNQQFDVIANPQPTPTATGNTTNLNSIFKDNSGVTWAVDYNGEAIQLSSPVFKELNQWHVDKAGNDTTGTGADEAPYLTITKALSVAPQADAVVVTEGTYAEAVTIATQNLTLRGEGNEYGGLTEINSLAVTASGTSVRVSSLTVLGNTTHTGTAPLYLADTTLNGNYTSSTTAYSEIRESRIQDGTISKTAAGILYITDSLIGNATFTTAGSTIAIRNTTIDAGDKVVIGAGVVYSIQDVVGDIEINAAAIPVEAALLSLGLTAEQAKAAQTSSFNMLRMLDPDTNNSNTNLVSWNTTTKRLEVSALPATTTVSVTQTNTTGKQIGSVTVNGVTTNLFETLTSLGTLSYNGTTGVLSIPYTDENGTTTTRTITIPVEIITTLTNTKVGNKIGTYTNESGTAVDINETITSIGTISYNSTTGVLTIPYVDETGVTNNKTVTLPTQTPSAVWTTATTDPTATGNTGILPRFVENTTNGSKWYIDSTGTAKLIEGAADGCGTVFFNALTPATATIFDDANPPVTDDPALKNLDCAVYVSAVDGSIWSSDGTTYKTKVYSYPLHQREVQTATASQTLFTLTKNPIGGTEQVHVSRNGVDISRAFTWAGNVGTYNPVNNYGCTFDANDTLQFHFEAL